MTQRIGNNAINEIWEGISLLIRTTLNLRDWKGKM